MGSPLLNDYGDVLQQIGLFLTLHEVENADTFYKAIVGARLLHHIWKKVSQEDEIDAHRNEALLAIADYVKKNPRATEEQIVLEVQKQINTFIEKIQWAPGGVYNMLWSAVPKKQGAGFPPTPQWGTRKPIGQKTE